MGILRRNILFENISDEEFDQLRANLEKKEYAAGEIVFEGEAEGTGIIFIEKGRIRISRKTKSGKEKVLSLLHAGDFFGELELVDGRPRSSKVEALDDCVTFTLNRNDFEQLLNRSHPVALRLLQVLGIRLRALGQYFMREVEQYYLRTEIELKKFEQIIEATKSLNSTLNLDKLLGVILETALRIVNGERGTVYLIDEARHELWSRVLKASEILEIRLPVGKGIAGYVAATGDTINIKDAYADPRFNPEFDRKTHYRTETILCMPMKDRDQRITGVFQLLNKRDGPFTREDEALIDALSVHAAIAVENARLYEAEQALARMQEEVRLAAKIQANLLPKKFPRIEGYDLAGTSIPAQAVGGDYFDFIPVDDRRIAICLGDVSGKGLPASLVMAGVQATLRGQTLSHHSSKRCLEISNKLLCESTGPDRFVTLFYGILDNAEHRFSYSNAGHNHPFVFSNDGRSSRLDVRGLAMGVEENAGYQEKAIQMNPLDLIVVYSDGVTEAMNDASEFFGEDRLVKVAKENLGGSASDVMGNIVAAVNRHTGDHPQMDDITLVVLKRM